MRRPWKFSATTRSKSFNSSSDTCSWLPSSISSIVFGCTCLSTEAAVLRWRPLLILHISAAAPARVARSSTSGLLGQAIRRSIKNQRSSWTVWYKRSHTSLRCDALRIFSSFSRMRTNRSTSINLREGNKKNFNKWRSLGVTMMTELLLC